MKKIVWTFGLIGGAVMSGMMLLALPFHEEIGVDNSLMLGYATMVAGFLLIYFGVKQYRDNVSGGTLSFGKALKVGALIALVASACYVATWEVVYFGGFAPGYMENYQTAMVKKWQAEGKPQSEIDKEVAELKVWAERYKNPAINAAITFLEPLPVALIMVLVSAGVLRRRPAMV